MKRLLVHVEGQTEEQFVNDVLVNHLTAYNYSNVSARLLGNARKRSCRGGIRSWESTKNEILNHMREDRSLIVTTMVDYYALPQEGNSAWPQRALANTLNLDEKPKVIETAMYRDIHAELGESLNPKRFIPFVVMHEFEALLFSDCKVFSDSIGVQSAYSQLQLIRDQFGSPEEINDSPQTAPSKRIISIIPNYEKPIYGAIGVLGTGIGPIRSVCKHFNDWLLALETID